MFQQLFWANILGECSTVRLYSHSRFVPYIPLTTHAVLQSGYNVAIIDSSPLATAFTVRSTLFFVPHEILGIPLFGFGWALGLLLLTGVIWLVSQYRSGHGMSAMASGGWVWLMAAVLIAVVLPSIEQRWPDGTPIGLPVRGYGLMVLLGLLTAIGITNIRAGQRGISTDVVVGLAIWSMLGGVVGARIFYVIQKWETFSGQGIQLVIEIVKLTEGGLVIYGGIIGGLIAITTYCYRHRLDLLRIGDLVVPGFLIGLAFGRIGCLLNGCCFGGICTAELPSIQFPHGSLPYISQLERGQLLGLELNSQKLPAAIQSVQAGSPAESEGVQAGDRVRGIRLHSVIPELADSSGIDKSNPTAASPVAIELILDSGRRWFPPASLPLKSLPVHPSQIYASINALLLCLVMWFLQPVMTRRGTVLFSGIALYALSRFLLEWIRTDEKGQFGTQLTIAQWIAVISGLASVVALAQVLRKPNPAK